MKPRATYSNPNMRLVPSMSSMDVLEGKTSTATKATTKKYNPIAIAGTSPFQSLHHMPDL